MPAATTASGKKLQKATLKKLEALALGVCRDLAKTKSPAIDIPLRTLSNVNFNAQKRIIEMGKDTQQRFFFNISMVKKFTETFYLSNECRQLIEAGKTTSLRDLFYMAKPDFEAASREEYEQEESDAITEDIEVTVDSLREELNLFASNRGALVGQLTIVDQGDTIDGRRMGSGGWSIPSIVEPNIVQFKKCDAKFILLVEKDAVWRRFNEDRFWEKYKCILVHGQGQPPRGVRRLLYRMANELKLPLYVFVDNDPWGYYIYSVIKQGSINLAYESRRMAVPDAKFIGLSSFDREKYDLDLSVTMKLKDEDVSRAKQILGYPWFQKKEWQKEIRNMLKEGRKLELEALSRKGISFVTEEYLPGKLKRKEWLD
ncbi:MAG: DNA topoisomerase IV subunit A [Planctomycetes bacterium]|nr:DNA topoisomerase IV subunit A [Planctomycetota bacterium]